MRIHISRDDIQTDKGRRKRETAATGWNIFITDGIPAAQRCGIYPVGSATQSTCGSGRAQVRGLEDGPDSRERTEKRHSDPVRAFDGLYDDQAYSEQEAGGCCLCGYRPPLAIHENVLTITIDNGSEFMMHSKIEKVFRTTVITPIPIPHGRRVPLRIPKNLYGNISLTEMLSGILPMNIYIRCNWRWTGDQDKNWIFPLRKIVFQSFVVTLHLLVDSSALLFIHPV